MSNLRGVLFALAAFGIFATHDVVVKYLGAIYTPFQIIFFSVLMTFPLVTLMLMSDATTGNLRPVHPGWIAARTAAGVVAGSSAFYAFSVLPLAQTYALLFATPLLITVLSIPVLGETVRLQRWAAVVVGLLGVVVVLRPGVTALGLGHAAGMMAALFSALASIIVRKVGREERAVVMLIYPLVANFMVMAAILPFVYKPMPIEHLGLIGVISLFSFGAGLLLIAAYKNGEAAIVAPMQYSQIIWASAYGYLFFQERLDTPTLVGTLIIIASGLYIVFRESRAKVSENQPVLRTRSRYNAAQSFRIGTFLRRRGGGK